MIVVRQDPLNPNYIALCLLCQNTAADSLEPHLLLVVPRLHVRQVCLEGVDTISVFSVKVVIETGDTQITLQRRERGGGVSVGVTDGVKNVCRLCYCSNLEIKTKMNLLHCTP